MFAGGIAANFEISLISFQGALEEGVRGRRSRKRFSGIIEKNFGLRSHCPRDDPE